MKEQEVDIVEEQLAGTSLLGSTELSFAGKGFKLDSAEDGWLNKA